MIAQRRRLTTFRADIDDENGHDLTPVLPLESERIPVRHAALTLRGSLAGSVVRPLRLQRRMRFNVDILVRAGQGTSPARMVDMSASGVGLVGKLGLEPSAEVELIFPDGSIHAAELIWSRGNRCGLVLAKVRRSRSSADALQPSATTKSGEADLAGRYNGVLFRLAGFVNSAIDGLRRRRTRRAALRQQRLIERAVRENGISWLAEQDRTASERS